MTEKFGELVLQRNYDTNTITVLGEVPDVIGIAEELLAHAEHRISVSGDDIYLDVLPERLHYRVMGRSIMQSKTLIAERIRD